jgi:hypothetical protein
MSRSSVLISHQALTGIDHHESYVASLEGPQGAERAVVLDIGSGAFAGAAKTGGVDERHGGSIEYQIGVDRVPGCAGQRGNDGALISEHGIQQGALAHIGTANDGHTHGRDCIRDGPFGRQSLDDFIE